MGLNLTYILRIVSIITGLIVLGFGLYTFCQSGWYSANALKKKGMKPSDFKLTSSAEGYHAICPLKQPDSKNCPPIELEHFYVAAIVICFLLSVALLILGCLFELSTNPFRFIDLLSHVLGAIFLVIAAIAYGVSAYLIRDGFPNGAAGDKAAEPFELLTEEKYVAAAAAFVQGVLFGIIAFFVSCNG